MKILNFKLIKKLYMAVLVYMFRVSVEDDEIVLHHKEDSSKWTAENDEWTVRDIYEVYNE